MTDKATPPTNADGDLLYAAGLLTPSAYATMRHKMKLYPWQAGALNELELPGSRELLVTLNESGKTSVVIAQAILWHMETFPNSLTITTSGSYNQIINQLYPALRAYTAQQTGWRIQKDNGTYANGSRLISFSTDKEGRAEGWHEPLKIEGNFQAEKNLFKDWGFSNKRWKSLVNEREMSLLMVIDEAKTVEAGIFRAFERCRPTRYLVTSSPGDLSGPFYDIHQDPMSDFTKVGPIDWRMCPHIADDPKRMRLRQTHMRTQPKWFVNSTWEGLFGEGGELRVFDMAKVDTSMSGTLPSWGRGIKRAALDLSGGGDEMPLYMCDGNRVTLLGSWRTEDDDTMVQEVIARLKGEAIKAEWFFVDEGGLGKIILNNFDRKGYSPNRVNFGEAARDKKLYGNRRAEMFCELANRIKLEELILPKDQELRDQLSWQKYRGYSSPMKLIDKKKMPHSPDRADTLAMLYSDFPAASEFDDRQEQINKAMSRTMVADDDESQMYQGTGLWNR